MNAIQDRAINKAKQSQAKYKISAIGLDRRGNLLGSACNQLRFSKFGGGLHAEMLLLHRYGNKVKTIILCRVGRGGDVLPIEPCDKCQKVLDKLKIKVVSITP
jgi:cytidine deaminase